MEQTNWKTLKVARKENKDNGRTVSLDLIDENASPKELYEVVISLDKYDMNAQARVKDVEYEAKTREMCQEKFGVDFELLLTTDIPTIDMFCVEGRAFFTEFTPRPQTTKFDATFKPKKIYTGVIEQVIHEDGKGIYVYFRSEDGLLRVQNMSYAKYNEGTKEWFLMPSKQIKQIARFKELFGVNVTDDLTTLIGTEINFEVKTLAFDTTKMYSEIKAI